MCVPDLNFRLSIFDTIGFGEPGVKHQLGKTLFTQVIVAAEQILTNWSIFIRPQQCCRKKPGNSNDLLKLRRGLKFHDVRFFRLPVEPRHCKRACAVG